MSQAPSYRASDVSAIVVIRDVTWIKGKPTDTTQIQNVRKMIASLDPSLLFRKKRVQMVVKPQSPYKKWTKKHILGEGGYGKVRLYRRGKKYVAIKTFKPSNMKEADTVKKVFNKELAGFEAADLHNTGHENIVKFKAAFREGDAYCLALEYCKAGDLSQIYSNPKSDQYTEKDIRSIVMQCCSGLKYLLDRNIVHRDIKDQNILVKQWKPIKVCIADLNFSKGIKDKNHSTEMNTHLGTKIFQAPEIEKLFLRNENQKYNHKIDIYSLGVLTYKLFTFNNKMPPIAYSDKLNEQIKDLRDNYHYKPTKKDDVVIKAFYETFNDRGIPLEPAVSFEKISEEAKYVLSRMLLPIYTARIDYDDILISDWSEKKYPDKLTSIKSYLKSVDALPNMKNTIDVMI